MEIETGMGGDEDMPRKLEEKLKREAAKKGLKGDRRDAYVYGTLQKVTDWEPGKKKGKK